MAGATEQELNNRVFVELILALCGKKKFTSDFFAISWVFYLVYIDSVLDVRRFFDMASVWNRIRFDIERWGYPFSGRLCDIITSLLVGHGLEYYLNTPAYAVPEDAIAEADELLESLRGVSCADIASIRAAARRVGELLPDPGYDKIYFVETVCRPCEAALLATTPSQ